MAAVLASWSVVFMVAMVVVGRPSGWPVVVVIASVVMPVVSLLVVVLWISGRCVAGLAFVPLKSIMLVVVGSLM